MLGSLRRSCIFASQNLLPDFAKYSINSPGFAAAVCLGTYHLPNRSGCQLNFHTDTSAQSYRRLSQISVSPDTSMSLASKEDMREFMAIFPDVVRELTDQNRYKIPEIPKRIGKILQYNVPGGKKNRAMALFNAYRTLVPESELTPENVRRVLTIGWCMEMLQAFFLMTDDVCDGSDVRRGRPCWYRLEDVGLQGINDALLVNGGIYEILRNHLRDQPYYQDVVDAFLHCTLRAVMGQSLDMVACNDGKPMLDKFTMNFYSSLTEHKTSSYSFVLPVAVAMHMAGIKDPEMHRQARLILLEMGTFFQCQDDYLDCFNTAEAIGKTVGNDIKEGKCTWLAVVALQRCNVEQRKIMEECYGKKHEGKAEAVRELYENLGLPATFALYEEETYNLIKTHIQQVSRGLPVSIFLKVLDVIYKRTH